MSEMSGIFWEPYQALEALLSASNTFQSWVGVATAKESKAFIYIFEERENVTSPRAAVILPSEDGDLTLKRDTPGVGLAGFGWRRSIEVGFQELVEEYTEDGVKDFLSKCGTFLDEIIGQTSRITQVSTIPWGRCPLRMTRGGNTKGYQKFLTLVMGTE